MSMSPEVNDIDISKLFQWRKVVEITGINDEPTTVYMRLIGDAELNMARVAGLRASAELRKKFKDVNSDEYLAYVPDVESTEKENLIELLIMLDLAHYRELVEKKVRVPFPKEPKSDSTLEAKEKYQTAVDNYPNVRYEKIKIELDKLVKKEKVALNKETKEEIIEKYKTLVINKMCESKLNSVFVNKSVYFGTYRDENYTERFFNSYTEFENIPTYAKDQFIDKYLELQITMSDLKK